MAVLVHILGDGAGVSSAIVLYPSEAGNPYAWLTIDDGFRPRCRSGFFGGRSIIFFHDTNHLVDVAFAVYDSAAAHLSNLVAGKLIAGTADRCSLCAASFILDPAEAWYPYVRLAVDDSYCPRLGVR